MKHAYPFAFLLLLPLFSCQEDGESPLAKENQGLEALAEASYPLEDAEDLDILLNEIRDARFVLLGEASHGTAEYYTWRAEISRRLIEEKGFSLIAVEGDWPDLYRLNQYIRGSSTQETSAEEVLKQLDRWPSWMWANEEVAAFGEWLRAYNQNQPAQEIGFYGLDVYSLWDSMEEVVAWLEETDPVAAEAARTAYACFAPFKRDEWAYAQATVNGGADCSEELVSVLEMVQQQAAGAPGPGEAAFNAVQNALTAVNAERYYAAAVRSNTNSWNIRDRHMLETINNLLEQQGPDAKIIVWEHNTHVGDARATSMAEAGMVNVGQLVREQAGEENVYIVGFGSYAGSVTAASSWGSSLQEMQVPEAREGSWEAMLHAVEPADKIVLLHELENQETFLEPLGHRAIGVVYNPGAEQGNYVPSILPQRYDAFLFIDQSNALSPLSESAGGRLGAGSTGIKEAFLFNLLNPNSHPRSVNGKPPTLFPQKQERVVLQKISHSS